VNIAFLAIMIWSVWMLLVNWLQSAAYAAGNYQRQLSIVSLYRFTMPAAHLFFRGAAYHQLGRLDQAERDLRQSLAKRTDAARRTVCRDELGLVLLDQARYDDALACFNECIAESPRRGGGYRGIAETLLRRGGEDAAALRSARLAVDADRAAKVGRGRLARKVYGLNLAESLAFLAWAQARSGAETVEVDRNLSDAFKYCGESTKPVLARIHYCAGQAYSALGNAAQSERHFQLAAQTDPSGNYGRLAGAATAATAS
jgi:tetratricopeptide (TPR) repeat protein